VLSWYKSTNTDSLLVQKVQILTLYWYKSTNTDAEVVCSAEDSPVLVYAIALAWDAVSGGIVYVYIYKYKYLCVSICTFVPVKLPSPGMRCQEVLSIYIYSYIYIKAALYGLRFADVC
jgi:hypothetical protein